MPPIADVALRVVIEQIECKLILQLRNRLKRRPIRQILVQRPPEPLDIPVRPRLIRPRIAMLDSQLAQQPFQIGLFAGAILSTNYLTCAGIRLA